MYLFGFPYRIGLPNVLDPDKCNAVTHVSFKRIALESFLWHAIQKTTAG